MGIKYVMSKYFNVGRTENFAILKIDQVPKAQRKTKSYNIEMFFSNPATHLVVYRKPYKKAGNFVRGISKNPK